MKSLKIPCPFKSSVAVDLTVSILTETKIVEPHLVEPQPLDERVQQTEDVSGAGARVVVRV